MATYRIRTLDAQEPQAVALVARRMRATLVEVLGEARGVALYTLDWLEARVRWHLDPVQCTGEVFLAADATGVIAGHTIVRVERDEQHKPIGLFSTTYVEPAARRHGVARQLLARGEAWMRERGLTTAVTYTDAHNTKLQQLYLGLGYTLEAMPDDFVRLQKPLG